MKKGTKIFFIVVAIAVVFIVANTYIKSKTEIAGKYNFVISKIEVSPTKSLVFYNGNTKVDLWNFDIRDYENVKVGDIIYKKENSKYLHFFRKNENTNKYVEVLKIESSLN